MRLFSEPTRRERLADFASDVTDRISDTYYDVAERLPDVTDTEVARGLGWASIGIGLTEVLAPRRVNHMLGLEDTPDRRGTLRVLGVREICQGIGILAESRGNEKMQAGVLARVAGDVLDSAALGMAATKTQKPFSFAVVSAMVLGIGLADLLCARRLSE